MLSFYLHCFEETLISVFPIFACLSLLSNHTKESNTSNFSMECGTYEQLGYWANNFDDFAVSNNQFLIKICLFSYDFMEYTFASLFC